jgi:spermidine/putrescine transport system ATP-binding protein
MNQGRIEDEGPPERVYAQPATRFSATFMGESTLLLAGLAAAIGGLPDPGEAGALAIRPEKLALDERPGQCRLGTARVETVVFQGSFKRVLARSLDHAGLVFVAKVEADAPLAPGDLCRPGCRPTDLIVLPR